MTNYSKCIRTSPNNVQWCNIVELNKREKTQYVLNAKWPLINSLKNPFWFVIYPPRYFTLMLVLWLPVSRFETVRLIFYLSPSSKFCLVSTSAFVCATLRSRYVQRQLTVDIAVPLYTGKSTIPLDANIGKWQKDKHDSNTRPAIICPQDWQRLSRWGYFPTLYPQTPLIKSWSSDERTWFLHPMGKKNLNLNSDNVSSTWQMPEPILQNFLIGSVLLQMQRVNQRVLMAVGIWVPP